MIEMGLQSVMTAIQEAFHENDREKVDRLLWPALDQFPEVPALWFFAANQHFEQGRASLAIQDFRRALELENNPLFWSNLGAALRRVNRTDEARRCIGIALEMTPDDGSALTNMCATYVNEGMPWPGIAYGEKALQSKQQDRAAWNLALLYLEAGEFRKGFTHYHSGVNQERQLRTYTSKVNRENEPALLEGDSPRANKSLIVYGEQGLGDEIMFGTVLGDALNDFSHIIFDCHPRLEGLHRRAYQAALASGQLVIHPTRKDSIIDWPLHLDKMPDYKAPLGDLCHLYRNERASFIDPVTGFGKGYGYYSEPDDLRDMYRARLELLAEGRKIVGFAMRGGVMNTNRVYRTIKEKDLGPLFERKDIMLVSLDYEDITLQMQAFAAKYGNGRYAWFPAVTHAWDYGNHTAALIAACDLTVTVCQSVAHLSAALGQPTLVLTPSRPAWRYGLEGESWYWYAHDWVRLLRQEENPRNTVNWGPAISRLVECLDEFDSF